MYPSTHRHQSSFAAVRTPSASAVVRTVLVAAAGPLAVVGLLSAPVAALALAAVLAVALRLLITDRARRPFRRGLAGIVGRGGRPDPACCENAT